MTVENEGLAAHAGLRRCGHNESVTAPIPYRTPVSRRAILVCAVAAPVVGGCASKPLRPVEADGTYCFKAGKSRRKVCTPQPVPGGSAEADAKRFEGAPGVMTVYVVRHRWADAANRVPVSIGGLESVVTIPESLVRVRVAPGSLRLSFEWEGRREHHLLSGKAGDVLFVELVGSLWAWNPNYRWEAGQGAEVRQRATNSRLIADLVLPATALARGATAHRSPDAIPINERAWNQ